MKHADGATTPVHFEGVEGASSAVRSATGNQAVSTPVLIDFANHPHIAENVEDRRSNK